MAGKPCGAAADPKPPAPLLRALRALVARADALTAMLLLAGLVCAPLAALSTAERVAKFDEKSLQVTNAIPTLGCGVQCAARRGHWDDTMLHGMAWHGMAWHGMAWHGMTWHEVPYYIPVRQLRTEMDWLAFHISQRSSWAVGGSEKMKSATHEGKRRFSPDFSASASGREAASMSGRFVWLELCVDVSNQKGSYILLQNRTSAARGVCPGIVAAPTPHLPWHSNYGYFRTDIPALLNMLCHTCLPKSMQDLAPVLQLCRLGVCVHPWAWPRLCIVTCFTPE
eukprot:357104-Chlamydomonas_euryale.AAC.2